MPHNNNEALSALLSGRTELSALPLLAVRALKFLKSSTEEYDWPRIVRRQGLLVRYAAYCRAHEYCKYGPDGAYDVSRTR